MAPDARIAAGELVFGAFAALAEFEREFIAERARAGLASARAATPRRSGGKRASVPTLFANASAAPCARQEPREVKYLA
jgi:DNA invertase Pin-like site-specific DNA recombinase